MKLRIAKKIYFRSPGAKNWLSYSIGKKIRAVRLLNRHGYDICFITWRTVVVARTAITPLDVCGRNFKVEIRNEW